MADETDSLAEDKKRLFTLESREYEVPLLSTIDLDEERILYLWSDIVIEDLIPPHPDWNQEDTATYNRIQAGRFRNPAFKRAMAHIAYRRVHPEADAKAIDAAIGKVNALELDLAVLWEEKKSPPAPSSQKPPESKSDISSPSKQSDSGSPTENGSDQADKSPAPTGTSDSDTSSPPSLVETSVS